MTCTYFRIIIHSTAYHHLQITWLSYFGSENQGLPLRSWFVTCWLWRHIPIVTSLAVPSSCVVTQTSMGTNSGTRRRKRKFPLLFVNCDRGRIEIDHLYGLRCRGWYCNPEQHSLCRPARPQAAVQRPAQLVLFRIAVPTTPAQTVSWSIPISHSHNTMMLVAETTVFIYYSKPYLQNALVCANWQWNTWNCVTGLDDLQTQECLPVTPVEYVSLSIHTHKGVLAFITLSVYEQD